jgi:hypothetical protein
MNPGAAMAFVIAGGVSSIPAAVAVWALVKPRVFAAYIAFALIGAVPPGGLTWSALDPEPNAAPAERAMTGSDISPPQLRRNDLFDAADLRIAPFQFQTAARQNKHTHLTFQTIKQPNGDVARQGLERRKTGHATPYGSWRTIGGIKASMLEFAEVSKSFWTGERRKVILDRASFRWSLAIRSASWRPTAPARPR